MDQYQEWHEEENNMPIKCPIHNCIISPKPNQSNYRINKISPKYAQPEYEIYPSPRQVREEIRNNQYNNYKINDLNQNKNMSKNYYNYPQYYQSKPQYNYSNQYNNSNSNIINNDNNSSLRRYESSDGVLRGYTNNYSFYVSGSSQIKPKITINSQYTNNNTNYNYNYNQNSQKRYINKNIPSPQRVGGQFQNIYYSNNMKNNIPNNRQINQRNNYIIKVVEDNQNIYAPPNRSYINSYNFNNNNDNDDVYYYESEFDNENEIRNIPPQRTYRGPIIQRRMVKRVVEKRKEPMNSRKGFYINENNTTRIRNNVNNINSINNMNNLNIEQEKPVYHKINNYANHTNVINLRKYNSSNENGNQIQNDIERKDYYISYSPRRINTPDARRTNKVTDYTQPGISRQQKLIGNNAQAQNYHINNSNNSVTYSSRGYYPYGASYIEQEGYNYIRTEGNSPRNKSPYLKYSPNVNTNFNNNVNKYMKIMPRQKEREREIEREYSQREFENNEDDDVYEVPEQYDDNINNNINSNREYFEERRQYTTSERPFMRINNYSQTQRNGKKYGVYTQTLAMNTNYNNNNEYEVDNRNIRNNNNTRENRNYSVPKIMRPINEVQRLVRQNKEYTAFERSLKNIRDNEEEIELDNEERNNRVKIKTSGYNNQGLYISGNNKSKSSRKYKTYTELQENRADGYILQDVDNSDDYDMYPNNRDRNRNIAKNNNLRMIKNEKQYRPQPGKSPRYQPEENNYYEEEYLENNRNEQNYNNRNRNGEEEIEDEDIDNNNDEEEQLYDPKQIIKVKEDNFRIVRNNEINQEQNNIHTQEVEGEGEEDIEEDKENQIEGQEQDEIIHNSKINNFNSEEDLYQRGEELPLDQDEGISPRKKNVKNIQTEINEKYYDNQGNYLGEKKIITTKQVPVMSNNEQREELEEGEYYEEQEEPEENENINNKEYAVYKSNKNFKKRGDKNIMNKESKYHSYFGDSNNNVYYEIKGSGDINREGSKNEEEVQNRKYKEPIVQVKNVTFGIQSENLCVPGQDNDNEEKENLDEKENTEEKEADEQQIDENAEIEEEEEEHNNINESKNNEELNNTNRNQNTDNDNNLQIKENENNNDNKEIKYSKNLQINQVNEYNYTDINENVNDNDNDNEQNNINEDNEDNEVKTPNKNFINNDNNANSVNKDDNIYKEQNININTEEKNNNINNNEQNNENNNIEKSKGNINENINYDDNNNGHNYEDENVNYENTYENENENTNNNNEYNNGNDSENNYEYNEEGEEQIVEENEGEEIIQKDEEREEDVGEGLVDVEDNNNYYEENEIIVGEKGNAEGEEEKEGEYNNIIEEENTNKEGDEENGGEDN